MPVTGAIFFLTSAARASRVSQQREVQAKEIQEPRRSGGAAQDCEEQWQKQNET
jgi:hypothetical protein